MWRIEDVKKNKMFKPWDIAVLTVILIFLGVSIFLLMRPTGKTVQIYIDGELYKEYALDTDNTFNIDKDGVQMMIIVKNGEVYVKESNCPNHLCEDVKISRSGESIICLPNKVIIKVSGKSEVDAIT